MREWVWNESGGVGDSPYAQAALKARAHSLPITCCAALYEHGGIYLDTDVEVLQPFDPDSPIVPRSATKRPR